MPENFSLRGPKIMSKGRVWSNRIRNIMNSESNKAKESIP